MYTLGFALVLVLRTYDMVGVPSREIATAERTAAALLARAQIEVSWISCQRAPAGSHDRLCDQTHQPSELIIRLVAVPGQATNLALADAYIDTDAAFGWFATIYVDRVRSLAAASGVDPGAFDGPGDRARGRTPAARDIGAFGDGTDACAVVGTAAAPPGRVGVDVLGG